MCHKVQLLGTTLDEQVIGHKPNEYPGNQTEAGDYYHPWGSE